MSDRIELRAERKRLNGSIEEKIIHIETFENGINISATGTITWESALKLGKELTMMAGLVLESKRMDEAS